MGWMTAANLQRDGYRGELSESSVTIAEALGKHGYKSYMTGKWHLTRYDHESAQSNQASWPKQRGFNQFYEALRGGSYFGPDTMVRNNERIQASAADFYFTDTITDGASQFVTDHKQSSPNKPFFCYVAYTAPHWPLQVPGNAMAKYRQRYAQGWDKLRLDRYTRMRRLGLLAPSWRLPARDKSIPAWDRLESEQQEDLVERMSVYAAQVELMDAGIGKLTKTLAENGQLKNTLILFVSDNGASAEGGQFGFERQPGGTIGTANSFASYGKGWASLSNTPFRSYKQRVHEGGIATPLIAHWPTKIVERGRLRKNSTHFIDIMPTILEAAKATYPAERLGKAVPPLEGSSLIPLFKGMAPNSRKLF
jgi:arylsulfatase A-like enzyme